MNSKKLAGAIRDMRGKIEGIVNDHIEVASESYDDLMVIKVLLSVLAQVVEGHTVAYAFGSPGDWGYETPIGAAIAEVGHD